MKAFIRYAAGVALCSLFAVVHASPPSVNPEQMDLDPDIMAKIFKEKSKRNTSGQAAAGSPGGSASKDCGTVNIASNEKKSNSGIGNIMGKQTTVVVTGDVINMANCK